MYACNHRQCLCSNFLWSPDKLKEEFFADLQHTLDDLGKEDVLLLVSNFNARVGSSTEGVVLPWEGVRGHHGIGRENETTKELLSFCALNELAIMNTFFEKCSIYTSIHDNIQAARSGIVLIIF